MQTVIQTILTVGIKVIIMLLVMVKIFLIALLKAVVQAVRNAKQAAPAMIEDAKNSATTGSETELPTFVTKATNWLRDATSKLTDYANTNTVEDEEVKAA